MAGMSEQDRPLTEENSYMAGKILAFEDIQKFLLGLAEEKLSQRDFGYFARTLERMEKTALQSSSPAAFEEGFGEVFGPIQELLLSKP